MGIHQGLSGFAGIFLAALVAQSLSLISTGYTNFFSRVWSAWQMVSQSLFIGTLSVIILNMAIPIRPEKKVDCIFCIFQVNTKVIQMQGAILSCQSFPKKVYLFTPFYITYTLWLIENKIKETLIPCSVQESQDTIWGEICANLSGQCRSIFRFPIRFLVHLGSFRSKDYWKGIVSKANWVGLKNSEKAWNSFFSCSISVLRPRLLCIELMKKTRHKIKVNDLRKYINTCQKS